MTRLLMSYVCCSLAPYPCSMLAALNPDFQSCHAFASSQKVSRTLFGHDLRLCIFLLLFRASLSRLLLSPQTRLSAQILSCTMPTLKSRRDTAYPLLLKISTVNQSARRGRETATWSSCPATARPRTNVGPRHAPPTRGCA